MNVTGVREARALELADYNGRNRQVKHVLLRGRIGSLGKGSGPLAPAGRSDIDRERIPSLESGRVLQGDLMERITAAAGSSSFKVFGPEALVDNAKN